MTRRRLFLVLALLALPVLVVAGANAWELLGARGEVVDQALALPTADAVLVLGAEVHPDGSPSPVLEDRVRAGVAAWKAHRAPVLLMSGDHGRLGYDEPAAMRALAVNLGVPPHAVFEDHAGFATWDSMVRARKVFGARRVIVVSQGYHLPRALFLAHRAGLGATGLRADLRNYGRVMLKLRAREVVARVKAFAQGTLKPAPRFLGPAISLHADGRSTWADSDAPLLTAR